MKIPLRAAGSPSRQLGSPPSPSRWSRSWRCWEPGCAGGGGFDIAWLPSWDARLAFRLDGLGALYALLATGIGVAVFTYATAYLPRHLEHEQRPQADGRRFHALMVLFMVAMVGLATAQDLLLLFVFWDLTAIVSYLLIGFDRQHREAPAVGADGAAGHRRLGGAAADRDPGPAGRVRHHLDPGAARPAPPAGPGRR